MNAARPGETEGQNAGAEGDGSEVSEVQLTEAVQEAIGRSLKAYYDDIAREPIPDRFRVLLGELEAQERKGGRRDE
ncbi:MAG: hypothetical protein JO107_07050 [Hyphomicrobiales bacterium]|nr:hypothetical protein [Hyphomicrobiales bacterium]